MKQPVRPNDVDEFVSLRCPRHTREYIERLERIIREEVESRLAVENKETKIMWFNRLDMPHAYQYLPKDVVIRIENDDDMPVEIDLSSFNSGSPDKELLRIRTLDGRIFIHPEASNVIVVQPEKKHKLSFSASNA